MAINALDLGSLYHAILEEFYKTGGTGNIAALAIYSGTLSAADVLAITTAMNLLPTAAAGMLLLAGIRDRKRGGKHGGKQ
jgi:hypothetical protein